MDWFELQITTIELQIDSTELQKDPTELPLAVTLSVLQELAITLSQQQALALTQQLSLVSVFFPLECHKT